LQVSPLLRTTAGLFDGQQFHQPSCRVMMATLWAVIAFAAWAAPSAGAAAPGVTLERATYQADGAAVRIKGSVTCPASQYAATGSMQVSQSVGDLVIQKRIIGFETRCDGTACDSGRSLTDGRRPDVGIRPTQ
jgi:hypothetical protein